MKNFLYLPICFLFFFGNITNAQDIVGFGKMKLQKIKNKRSIKGLHKTYMGQIVFANERIPFKKPAAAAFISSYTFGDELYMREYWDHTMEEYYEAEFSGKAWDNAALLYVVTIDGQVAVEHIEYHFSGQASSVTWFTAWAVLNTSSAQQRGYIYNKLLKKAVANAKNIQANTNHQLEITSYIYDGLHNKKGKQLATGSLNITIPSDALSQHKASFVSNTTYPECLPSPAQTNTNLEDALLQATLDKRWNEQHQHVVLTGKEFKLIRHPISGTLEGRTMGASVSAKLDDRCWYQNFTFYQAHDGNDYQKTWTLQSIGQKASVPCSCLDSVQN